MTAIRKNSTLKQRNAHLDLIRVVAMLFVIAIHTEREFHVSALGSTLFSTILFTANGLFFLISGYLAFKFEEDPSRPAASYRTFYWKKFCSLVIPLVFYTTILMMNYYYWDPLKNFLDYPNEYFMDTFWVMFPDSTNGYKWFIYNLIGFMITVPFMKNMFKALSDEALKCFFIIAVGFEAVSVILFSQVIGIPFSVTGWPFMSWYFYFLCGYIIYRLKVFHEKKKLFIAAGIICLAATTLLLLLSSEPPKGGLDNSPVYLFACIGVYLLLESIPVNKYAGKALAFIGDNSYAVYLLHYEMMLFVRSKVSVNSPLSWVGCIFIIAALSLAVAIPCNMLILKPLSKYLTKKASFRTKAIVTAVILIYVIGIPLFLILRSRLPI